MHLIFYISKYKTLKFGFGLVWFGLVWIGLGWVRPGSAGPGPGPGRDNKNLTNFGLEKNTK